MFSNVAPCKRFTGSRRLPVFAFLSLVLVSQSLWAQAKASEPEVDAVPTMATIIVNGVPLEEAALQREMNRLAPVAQYHSLSKERWQAIREQAINNLVEKELFFREGLRRGIGWDEDWVEFIFEKNKKEYAASGRDASFFEDKQVKGRLYEELRQAYVISKLWQQGKERTTPTDEEIKAWYLDNKDRYKAPLAVKVKELTLSIQPSASKTEWDKSKKRAEKIYRQLEKSGDIDTFRGKTGIKIAEKTLHDGMQTYDVKALADLADQQIHEPSFSLHGYRIIQKLSTLPQAEFSLEQVKKQVEADVHNTKYNKWLDELKQELHNRSEIIIGAGPEYVGR